MNGVVLKSRFPEIAAELPIKLDGVAKAGAELIAADAKEKVPVATGALRDAIHTEKVRKGTHAVVAGDKEAFYAGWVEHGTTRNAPQPFLIPALEEEKPEVYALAEAAVRTLA